jgi:crotonobetainyl-CoA:carnitine CoA-transferase CaiB-like acyl-CoA transferase
MTVPAALAPALSGLRVLELGSLIAGPFAGRLLADFGADVIKVEDPRHPDPLREWGQARLEGHPLWWSVQSRGKRLITLDLRREKGRDLLRRLLSAADVLIENFRPGTLENWGLAPEELWKVNPGLVIARVSGYGQTGANARKPGYASVAEAYGGMRYLNGTPGEPPPRSGLSMGDTLAAMFAMQGILTALYWRDAGGGRVGQVVDVSLVESCFAMLESVASEYGATGEIRQPSGTGLKGIAPSNLFRSGDGDWVIIAANQDSVFRRLTQAMNRPDLPQDPRFAGHAERGVHQEEIEAIVAAWAKTLTTRELVDTLNRAAVPAGPVHTIADIFADPYFREREQLVTASDPALGEIVMPGVVPRLSATPGAVGRPGPLVPGHDNNEVYRSVAGLSEQEIRGLEAEGTI